MKFSKKHTPSKKRPSISITNGSLTIRPKKERFQDAKMAQKII